MTKVYKHSKWDQGAGDTIISPQLSTREWIEFRHELTLLPHTEQEVNEALIDDEGVYRPKEQDT